MVKLNMPRKSILWSFDLVGSCRVWFSDEGSLYAVMIIEIRRMGSWP